MGINQPGHDKLIAQVDDLGIGRAINLTRLHVAGADFDDDVIADDNALLSEHTVTGIRQQRTGMDNFPAVALGSKRGGEQQCKQGNNKSIHGGLV